MANRLAYRGASVTVVDSLEPGSGTSGTSLAWLNSNQKLPRQYHDLSVLGMNEWRDLADHFGQPSWYVPTGSLTWADTNPERTALGGRIERLRAWGYPAEELTIRQAVSLEPSLRVPAAAYVAYFAGEAFVHGDQAVDALLGRAQAAGARLIVSGGDVVLEEKGSRVMAIRL